jgi:hypothetical protein
MEQKLGHGPRQILKTNGNRHMKFLRSIAETKSNKDIK